MMVIMDKESYEKCERCGCIIKDFVKNKKLIKDYRTPVCEKCDKILDEKVNHIIAYLEERDRKEAKNINT